MKPTLIRLCSVLFLLQCTSFQILAQAGIISMTVVPTYPTEMDNIEMHVDLQFPSSDCQLDNKGFYVNGTTISANTMHCLGMLTAICNTTDIFEIDQLPAGNYTFDLTLSSGYGDVGCSPGIMPDDNDEIQFTVSSTVGMDEISFDESTVYPNPTTGMLYLKTTNHEVGRLSTLTGKTVRRLNMGSLEVDLSDLSSGVYILSIGTSHTRVVKN